MSFFSSIRDTLSSARETLAERGKDMTWELRHPIRSVKGENRRFHKDGTKKTEDEIDEKKKAKKPAQKKPSQRTSTSSSFSDSSDARGYDYYHFDGDPFVNAPSRENNASSESSENDVYTPEAGETAAASSKKSSSGSSTTTSNSSTSSGYSTGGNSSYSETGSEESTSSGTGNTTTSSTGATTSTGSAKKTGSVTKGGHNILSTSSSAGAKPLKGHTFDKIDSVMDHPESIEPHSPFGSDNGEAIASGAKGPEEAFKILKKVPNLPAPRKNPTSGSMDMANELHFNNPTYSGAGKQEAKDRWKPPQQMNIANPTPEQIKQNAKRFSQYNMNKRRIESNMQDIIERMERDPRVPVYAPYYRKSWLSNKNPEFVGPLIGLELGYTWHEIVKFYGLNPDDFIHSTSQFS